MSDYLDELNDVQRDAVQQTEGALMIIAGAGSGKTRVLTYRIAHLMRKGVSPFNILALTFTNKAAREMQKRIRNIAGAEAKYIWMGTFHSVFSKILRKEGSKLGYPYHFTIYDTQDSVNAIRTIVKEMQLDKETYDAKKIQSRISKYKNNLITVKAYQNNAELQQQDMQNRRPRMGEIYQQYVESCFNASAMDFDDLLLKTNELLTRFPEVLEKYQQLFQYIMVDEYQDTNHSQYLIVKALAHKFKNICVVGDDAQSIYSFRGANINNILNFKKDYPNTKTIKLEQNYRSTNHIVSAANSVIKNNRKQLEKDVFTDNENGEPIQVFKAVTDGEEGKFIARSIYENKIHEEVNYSDFAVLYRTNMQSRAVEDALRKRNIPYRVYGGLSFYQRKEVKDAIAYFRVVVNPKDEEALKRIINYPTRGIGATTLTKIASASQHYGKSSFEIIENLNQLNILNAGTIQKLHAFASMIKHFRGMLETHSSFEVCEAVLKQSGLIQLLHKDQTPEGISRYENLQELINGIKDFCEKEKQLVDGDPSLSNYLENIALASDIDNKTEQDEVALMTVHTSKGLEFPVVYIAGMEEDLFPSTMSESQDDLEEERRLFYVALTRGERKVYLSFADSRYKWGKMVLPNPSRFLSEIASQHLNLLNFQSLQRDSYASPDEGSNFGKNVRIRMNKPTNSVPIRQPKGKNLRRIKPDTGISNPLNNVLIAGNIVEHNLFGRGTIIELSGNGGNKIAKIQFENEGEKKLLLKFAKLKVVG